MTKTNAIRVLEREGVAFEVRAYEVDESDLSAETVAAKVGLPPERVFKTIIGRGDKTGPLFALIPAGAVLEPRLLAAASGNKRVEVAQLREVLALTGYVRGAVTVLAARKPYPAFVDETAELWPSISVSAGVRGLQVLVAPADLLRVTGAIPCDIACTA